MISSKTDLRDRLEKNKIFFRNKMMQAGFDILEGDHPIVPIMLYDARLAQDMADELLKEGVYVIGFYYPVVPEGKARIRVQISASMIKENLEKAIKEFKKVGKLLNII